MDEDFLSFRPEIEAEYELKEEIRAVVRETEQRLRELLSLLQKVHSDARPSAVAATCADARAKLPALHAQFAVLATKIQPLHFFKHHELYRFVIQRSAFVAAFLQYLESGELGGLPATASALGLGTRPSEGLHLDLEDYLHGLLELAKELARLSVNAVVVGDFERPFKAHAFLTELDAGFRSLNLKNDGLRRRFDALKYDLKKVEEVVYDLSIRNLRPKDAATEPTFGMESQ